MKTYTVENKISSPVLSDTKIEGSIAEQMHIFLENRVFSDYAKNVVYKETEDAFREQKDDETPVGWWRGEFWGKWVISACRVCRYSGDEKLKEFLHNAALTLLSLQRGDGYIGTYKDSLNVFAADPEKTKPIIGWPCNWNWNIWCRKYTLWGLLECYLLTDDDKILNGAVRFANQLIDELANKNIRLCDVGTFNGLPAGSIIKPMLILYRITEGKKYLDFAVQAAEYWDSADGKIPNLIANARSGKPTHEWYPRPEKWAKAYEMMSCLDGLLELYRVTGTQKYFETVETIYELLYQYEQNNLFSVGFNDIFANGAKYINTLSEPCDVIHWMRVSYELFKLSGNSKYMDAFEKAFLNPFLAASFSDGKWGARAVRSAGRHMAVFGQSGMKHSHCCVNNMPRGYMNAAEAFVMYDKDDLYINLFTEFEATVRTDHMTVNVKIGGTYLHDGQVSIKVDTTAAAQVHVRIPAWSKKTVMKINGQPLAAKTGEYCSFHAAQGVTVVSIAFDMMPVIRNFDHVPEAYPEDDFRIIRWISGNDVPVKYMTWDRRSTVTAGPLLLTRSKKINNTVKEMFETETICGKGYLCKITPVESDRVRSAFKAEFTNGGKSFSTMLCDYATGTNCISEDDDALFNIYF